jgi:nitroreductase
MAINEKPSTANLKREVYLVMPAGEFRAYFRQRIHLSLEKNLYWSIYNRKVLKENLTATAKELLNVWKEKGLSLKAPDYLWAVNAVETAENWIHKKAAPDFSKFAPRKFTDAEIVAFDTAVLQRRSVRIFTGRRVSDKTINALLEAGIWAANSCNQQALRFVVVREDRSPGLISVNMPEPAPVHILILQDERNYHPNEIMPEKNRLLDSGAAAQNILLAAHVHGLAGVWLTHSDRQVGEISKRLGLEDHYKFITYLDIGYPAVIPPPVARMDLSDFVLKRL